MTTPYRITLSGACIVAPVPLYPRKVPTGGRRAGNINQIKTIYLAY
jgi:hypothetical protein